MNATTRVVERSTRYALLECVLVAVVVFVVYALSRPDAVATLGRLYDDVVYLSVGKSIADGHGYRSAELVGTPVHVKFPPLLPAVYAVGWELFGSLGAVARMALWLNFVVVAVSAGALWWLATCELQLGRVITVLFVLVPVVTDRAMFYVSGAASEPWMLLGWTVALILVRRLTRQPDGPVGLAAALGVTLALTTLARTQGVAIAAGILIGLPFTRPGWKTVIVAATAAATPLLAWSVWQRAEMAKGPLSPLPDQRGYIGWIPLNSVTDFSRFAARMIRASVPLYWSNAADVMVGWTSPKTLAIAAAMMLCGIVGTVMLVRVFPAMAASIAATLAVLAIWPYVQDRFLIPLLPILGIAGAFAVERILTRLARAARPTAVAGAGLVTAALVFANARMRIDSARGSASSPYAHAIDEIVRWVDGNTSPGEHLMVGWGGAIYLRTGRRTSIPDPEEPMLTKSVLADPFRFYATRIIADSVDDVIIWDRAPGRAAPLLRALGAHCPGLLFESSQDSVGAMRSDVHFYRVRRELSCLAQNAMSPASGPDNKNAP